MMKHNLASPYSKHSNSWQRMFYFAISCLILVSAWLIATSQIASAEDTTVDLYIDHTYTRLDRLSETAIEVTIGIANKDPKALEIPADTLLLTIGEDVVILEKDLLIDKVGLIKHIIQTGYLVKGLAIKPIVLPLRIDPQNAIPEIDDVINNEDDLVFFHPQAYPDLVISNVKVSPDPAEVPFGNKIDYTYGTFTVTNVGGGPMTREMRMSILVPAVGQQACGILAPEGGVDDNIKIPHLPPGEGVTITGRIGLQHIRADSDLTIQSAPVDYWVRLEDPLAMTLYANPGSPKHISDNDRHWSALLQQYDTNTGTFKGTYNDALHTDSVFFNIHSPLEIGSEMSVMGTSNSSYSKGGVPADCADAIPPGYEGNNIYYGQFNATTPKPSTLYPNPGKVFTIGAYPYPPSDDWFKCGFEKDGWDCLPEDLTKPQPDLEGIKAYRVGWVDSILRFRWMPYTASEKKFGDVRTTTLQIHRPNGTVVHQAVLDYYQLGAGNHGAHETGNRIDEGLILDGDYDWPPFHEYSRHYDEMYAYRIQLLNRPGSHLAKEVNNPDTYPETTTDKGYDWFEQYVGPTLEELGVGTYCWRVKFGTPGSNDIRYPWSTEDCFSIIAPNAKLIVKEQYFGKVVEVDPSGKRFVIKTDTSEVKFFKSSKAMVVSEDSGDPRGSLELNERAMVSASKQPVGGDRTYTVAAPRVANNITVIPEEPLGSHKLCTVVGKTDDGRTSLACNDGVQITVDDTGLPAGTNAVMLVHPEQPSKLISTAESLMDRMSRFQALMTGQDDLSTFDSLKDTVETGFFTAQKQAVNAAPPEVKELMAKLGNIQQRITDLAKAFTSGDPNVTVSSSDIDTLATMLAEFAASPEKLLDVMIDGYEDDVPSEEKQELKDLIYSKSVDHFSYLNISLLEIVALLKDGDLETALDQLEAVTASDEVWEQNVVMPIMNDFYGTLEEQYNEEYDESVKQLAEDVKAEIVMVQELLELDTDWIEPATKTQLEETLADLQTALTDDDPDAMYESLTAMVELMQSLPTEHEVSGGEEYGEGSEDDGSIQELVDAANAEILFAENMLEEYADSITETASQNIRDLISNLRQLLTGNDRDKIYSALTDLMDSLAFSEGDSESPDPTYVDIQCPPKFPVGHELNCSFKYDGLLEGHTWTAVFSVDNSKITSTEWLFVATYEQLGTVSLSLTACGKSKCIDATHSIEIAEPKTNGGETSPDDHTGEQGQSSADDHTSGEGQSSGEQGPSSSDGHSGEQGQPSSNGPSVDFSIEIECSPEIQVDQPIACSFKHSGAPDKITWSAPDGNPSTGSGNTFQTSFSTLGQASISLEACMESLCKTDTHTIMVIPKPEEVEPSQEENDQQDDSQDGY